LLDLTCFAELSFQKLLKLTISVIEFFKKYIISRAIRGISKRQRALFRGRKMQTEELACVAKKVRDSLPNVESFPIVTIYTTIKEQDKTQLNLPDFKELIYHLAGWDISFQVICRQLEINQIV
jgi:hypothetical protein